MNLLKTHSHTLITIMIMVVALIAGTEFYVGMFLIGFWTGREHSQAEYRFMKLKKINRDKLGYFDALKKEAWNVDSFVNDMILPVVVSVVIMIAIEIIKKG